MPVRTCVPRNRFLKPAPPWPPSLLPVLPLFPGLETPSRNICCAPTAGGLRTGLPVAPLRRCCSSPLPSSLPTCREPGSQLPRLRHGIRSLLPSASLHLLPRGRLLIGESVVTQPPSPPSSCGHAPRAATGSSSSFPPLVRLLPLIYWRRAEKFWPKYRELAARTQRQRVRQGSAGDPRARRPGRGADSSPTVLPRVAVLPSLSCGWHGNCRLRGAWRSGVCLLPGLWTSPEPHTGELGGVPGCGACR